jgi:hypothetical protein
LGETDLAAFQAYFGSTGGCVVLALDPLSPDEQIAVLTENGQPEPQSFIEEAERRGLEELLANPQNLIMLANVVGKRDWPNSRSELFLASIEILLSEHNVTHTRQDFGRYTPAELADPAGAACAARLISDVDGISLRDGSADEYVPTYRDLQKLAGLEPIAAALTRRAFIGVGKPRALTIRTGR